MFSWYFSKTKSQTKQWSRTRKRNRSLCLQYSSASVLQEVPDFGWKCPLSKFQYSVPEYTGSWRRRKPDRRDAFSGSTWPCFPSPKCQQRSEVSLDVLPSITIWIHALGRKCVGKMRNKRNVTQSILIVTKAVFLCHFLFRNEKNKSIGILW